MSAAPKDIDKKQTYYDSFRRNRYRLDTRFVLQDGKRHPFAVVCPGGGYGKVCSYVEGVPLARRLNKLGEERLRQLIAVQYADRIGTGTRTEAESAAVRDALIRALDELLAQQPCFTLKSLAVGGKELVGFLEYGI